MAQLYGGLEITWHLERVYLWIMHTGGGWSGEGEAMLIACSCSLEPACQQITCEYGKFLNFLLEISSFTLWRLKLRLVSSILFIQKVNISTVFYATISGSGGAPDRQNYVTAGPKQFALFPFFLKYFMKMCINCSLSHIFHGTRLHIFLGPLVDSGNGAVSPWLPHLRVTIILHQGIKSWRS